MSYIHLLRVCMTACMSTCIRLVSMPACLHAFMCVHMHMSMHAYISLHCEASHRVIHVVSCCVVTCRILWCCVVMYCDAMPCYVAMSYVISCHIRCLCNLVNPCMHARMHAAMQIGRSSTPTLSMDRRGNTSRPYSMTLTLARSVNA